MHIGCAIGWHRRVSQASWIEPVPLSWCERCGKTWEQRPHRFVELLDPKLVARPDLSFGRPG